MFDFLIGLVALAYFLVISSATRQHFASEKFPRGMYVISLVSLVGLFAFLTHAFLWSLEFTVASLVLMGLAFALFFWAVRHSKQKNLSLAFDEETKVDGIITTGPWRYVRHPFYVSYILFWLACALGTTHPTSVVVFATLLFIYIYSALREERTLKQGRYADAYLAYQENAGFLLPKLVSRTRA
ncbi:isoprenylcysteine carboxylmethyltransferase family protein [Marivita sp.]|uniref:methyltransferase family protein n=1 Tax=Marivita sp. TaxID=2003365 RepID=UPI0025BBFF91|nr:isoprenylcysteine carboxylmethyltransferase family protein [Marivita sp.]